MLAEEFRRTGYVTLDRMLDPEQLTRIEEALTVMPADCGGARQMLRFGWCAQLAQQVQRQLTASGLIPDSHIAVQCTYFEKSVSHNWLVARHQDLSIPVQSRIDDAALCGWSEKDGTIFVQAPLAVLQQLIALRLHVDECGVNDGALKVVPASHLSGRILEADKSTLRDQLGEAICPVVRGGGMAMSPLLLHASSKSSGHSRRRVLHFLFGPATLPHGLAWDQSTASPP